MQFHKLRVLLLAVCTTVGGIPVLSAQEKPHSFSLFYSYRAKPENRPALRDYMVSDGAAQFEKWKAEGVIKDYMILFSTYVHINHIPWDMLIRVDFENYAATDRWTEIEHTLPAGLPPKTLAIAMPDNLNVGETLVSEGMDPKDAGRSVYDVSYYVFKVPPEAGKNFIKGYVQPQEESFVRNHVVKGYGIYLNRYDSKDWSYLILTEYEDSKALDARVARKNQIRGKLDPAWQTLNGIKAEHVRDEPFGFLAQRIAPH